MNKIEVLTRNFHRDPANRLQISTNSLSRSNQPIPCFHTSLSWIVEATVHVASERETVCLTATPLKKNTNHEYLTALLVTQLRLKPCRSQYELNAARHNTDGRKTVNLLTADTNSNDIRTLTGSDYNLRSEIEKESKSRAAEKLKTSYSASLLETLGGEVHV